MDSHPPTDEGPPSRFWNRPRWTVVIATILIGLVLWRVGEVLRGPNPPQRIGPLERAWSAESARQIVATWKAARVQRLATFGLWLDFVFIPFYATTLIFLWWWVSGWLGRWGRSTVVIRNLVAGVVLAAAVFDVFEDLSLFGVLGQIGRPADVEVWAHLAWIFATIKFVLLVIAGATIAAGLVVVGVLAVAARLGGKEGREEAFDFVDVAIEEMAAIRSRRDDLIERLKPARRGKPRGDREGDGIEPERGDEPRAAVETGDVSTFHRKVAIARADALREHHVGLTFSGGGIRSATFSVGILQGLASLKLLSRFDYLSTVSGGGYAAGWLAAWIKRDGDPGNVESLLDPSRIVQSRADRDVERLAGSPPRLRDEVTDEEPEPLYHLRSYSSFMMPRPGLSSVDTWTILAIWARNLLINLLVLLPVTILLVVLVRWLVSLYDQVRMAPMSGPGLTAASIATAIGAVAFLWSSWVNAEAIEDFRRGMDRPDLRRGPWRVPPVRFRFQIVAPVALASLAFTVAYPFIESILATDMWSGPWMSWTHSRHLRREFWSTVSIMAVFSAALGVMSAISAQLNRTWGWRRFLAAALAGLIAGLVFAAEMGLFAMLKLVGTDHSSSTLLAVLGPPAALLVVVIGTMVAVAVCGRAADEAEREWWARLDATLLIAAIGWAVLTATILYLPPGLLKAPAYLKALAAVGWVGLTGSGLSAGRTLLANDRGSRIVLGLIAGAAPPVFLAGLLGLTALLVSGMVDTGAGSTHLERYWSGIALAGPPLAAVAVISVLMAGLGFFLIDVNLFSLNAMYANRVIRCYLGATRGKARWAERWGDTPRPGVGGGAPIRSYETSPDLGPVEDIRRENRVTDFDIDDDIPLMDLAIGSGPRGLEYKGPLLLINTSLNLVAGKELAWRDRKCESFVLSPLFCGSKGTGFARLWERNVPADSDRRRLKLGRAMAISGASVDPNMSYYQSTSLTALMTVFNARLGYWIENPDRQATRTDVPWMAKSPFYALRLLDEFSGRTDAKRRYVHLSDGGHFENLGVYELIRRRCRYIVCCDAGEDTAASDENLANLVRLVRIDFGVRINLDTNPLMLGLGGRLSRSHVVIGSIRYDDVDNGQMPGVLVYIKISMTGDESTDVQNYAGGHERFPHDWSDLRQTFDESQFESYRSLGDHIARVVFADPLTELRRKDQRGEFDAPDNRFVYVDGIKKLFGELRNRWIDQAPVPSADFLKTTDAFIQLQAEFRKDFNLNALCADLYPDLHLVRPVGPMTPERQQAELHAVTQMLQIMEDTWVNLGLSNLYEVEMNRSWMNVFRRWAGTATFHRLWPVLRPSCGSHFVQFCESQLHLSIESTLIKPRNLDLKKLTVEPRPDPHSSWGKRRPDASHAAILELDAEFQREWPAEFAPGTNPRDRRRRGIIDRLGKAHGLAKSGRVCSLPIWLIWVNAVNPVDPPGPDAFVAGVIAVHEWSHSLYPSRNARPDPKIPVVELFAWIRPAHRSMGLGTSVVRRALSKTRAYFLKGNPKAETVEILVRYPEWRLGGGSVTAVDSWRRFYALNDFEDVLPDLRRTPQGEQILRRVLTI